MRKRAEKKRHNKPLVIISYPSRCGRGGRSRQGRFHMLKHENASQTQLPNAAQVRVTPEELAAAVTALQIRKEGQSGTIAIGDAVEELGLDVTPEEVLAEVQARRQAAPKKKRQLRGQSFVLALGIAGVLLGLAVDSNVLTQAQSIQLVPGTEPYHLEPRTLALAPVSSKPLIMTLAEAPDGKTVYCSPHAIYVAAMSRNTQETQPEIREPVTEMNWPVVKYGKELYVRGWIRSPLSKAAAKLSEVEVFNKPSVPQLGATPQQITLKLDLQTSGVGLGYQRLNPDGTGELVFHEPRLTARAYEKW